MNRPWSSTPTPPEAVRQPETVRQAVPGLDAFPGSAPLAMRDGEAAGLAAPRRASSWRRRARVAVFMLGGLLFAGVPRPATTDWREYGWPSRAGEPSVAAEGATRWAFGVPLQAVTATRGPARQEYRIEPLALLADTALGAFALAVFARWRRLRRGPASR